MKTLNEIIFYKSIRIGKYGKPFTFYKFRTMVVGSETMGGPSTAADDVRITRIGRFLRKWKIDEIPGLINVLKGDCELIGNRPTVSAVIETFDKEEKEDCIECGHPEDKHSNSCVLVQ